jgi:hypothetical protein
MSDKTLKVEPWGQDQGDYVVIDADTFDESIHTLFGEGKSKDSGLSVKDAKARLDALGVEYKCNASKGDLQALVEESEIKLAAVKAELSEKGIEFDDDAKLAELQALIPA